MTWYVTKISSPISEPPELQVMHKMPLAEPADREDRSMAARLWLPTRDDLDRATARTATAMADPDKCPADRLRMAQLEAVQHHQYLKRPGADAELQRDAERELAEYDREAGQ